MKKEHMEKEKELNEITENFNKCKLLNESKDKEINTLEKKRTWGY